MPARRIHPARIFLPFALGYFLSYLLRTVNAVISPALTAEFQLAAGDLGLLTSTYFFAFALAQLPIGIALDRFGPGRTASSLLLFAALGCAAFALANNLVGLAAARALIGLGVSSTLMAAFKGFSLWFERRRHASITGLIMATGALGAITASVPVEWALATIGWRGVFWLLAATALLAATSIHLCIPRPFLPAAGSTPAASVTSLGEVFRAGAFWRYAGQAACVTGGFMAMQGLWAAPWLIQVDGLTHAQTARYLLLLNCGMLVGQLSIAALGNRLAAHGVQQVDWLRWGIALTVATECAIIVGVEPGWLMWVAFGLFNACNAQQYGALARHFPVELYGRITTALNLLAFVGAFAIQWGFGALLDVFQMQGQGVVAAFRWCFGSMVLLQALSSLPLWRESRQHLLH